VCYKNDDLKNQEKENINNMCNIIENETILKKKMNNVEKEILLKKKFLKNENLIDQVNFFLSDFIDYKHYFHEDTNESYFRKILSNE
jgi:hypothetical protein